MGTNKYKVKLSPRLQQGVGRATGSAHTMKYASILFLVIGAVLIVRAGYMVIHRSDSVETPHPQVLGANDTPTPEALFEEYTIKAGDTVFSISQQYNIVWTTLATLNSLKPPFNLKPGNTLKIPKQ